MICKLKAINKNRCLKCVKWIKIKTFVLDFENLT